ncbi:MAG: DUF202 domain-containing protein [Solirubrobacterales bacterium]
MADPPEIRSPDDTLIGPSRRTVLAAERTWLAWFRTAIAVAATSIAVGGVIPRLVDGAIWQYVALGVGYSLLAFSVFIGALFRHNRILTALQDGEDVPGDIGWLIALTTWGGVLSAATLLVLIIEL